MTPITFTVQYNSAYNAFYISYQNNLTGRGGSDPHALTANGVREYIDLRVREFEEEQNVEKVPVEQPNNRRHMS